MKSKYPSWQWDELLISFDKVEGTEDSNGIVLEVMKENNGQQTVINKIHGREAERLYRKLTGQQGYAGSFIRWRKIEKGEER